LLLSKGANIEAVDYQGNTANAAHQKTSVLSLLWRLLISLIETIQNVYKSLVSIFDFSAYQKKPESLTKSLNTDKPAQTSNLSDSSNIKSQHGIEVIDPDQGKAKNQLLGRSSPSGRS